jgi:hypothetical protein
MSLTAEIKVEEKKGESVLVVCGECCRETAHEILTNVGSHDSDAEGDIQVWDHYLTLQCRGCRTLSFCRESQCTEDIGPDNELITARTLFPGRIAGRPRLSDIHHLPPRLWNVYEESRSALMAGLPILTGIGIRAIVEAVCNEEGSSGRDLYHKIKGLLRMGVITQKEAAIIQNLRFMGNEAAHNVKAHTQAELNIAFDVVEHLLKTVYLLPEQTKRLPRQLRRPRSTMA